MSVSIHRTSIRSPQPGRRGRSVCGQRITLKGDSHESDENPACDPRLPGHSLGGCSTQLTVRAVPETNSPAPGGLVYYLPYVEYEVGVERRIRSCRPQPTRDMMEAWLIGQVETLDNELTVALEDLADLPAQPKAALEAKIKARLGNARKLVEPTLTQSLRETPSGWRLSDEEDVFDELLRRAVHVAIVEGSKGFEHLRSRDVDRLLTAGGGQIPASVFLRQLRQLLPEKAVYDPRPFEVRLGAEVTPRYLADHTHAFYIAHEEMSSGLKKTTLEVNKYDNGTLKSINATIDDHTDKILLSAVKGTLRLAAAAGGFPITAVGGAESAGDISTETFAELVERYEICKPSVSNTLTRYDALRRELEATFRDIAKRKKQIAEAKAKAGATSKELTAAKAALAAIEAKDPKRAQQAKKVKALVARLKKEEGHVKKKEDAKKVFEQRNQTSFQALAGLRRQLSVTTVHIFRPGQDEPGAEVGGVAEAASEWFLADRLKRLCQASGN